MGIPPCQKDKIIQTYIRGYCDTSTTTTYTTQQHTVHSTIQSKNIHNTTLYIKHIRNNNYTHIQKYITFEIVHTKINRGTIKY